jgi:CheY-like chemotaxis protein
MKNAEPLKLLIVDDSASSRRLIKTFLADIACEVYECSDGSEAVAAYALHRPDFVLMDIQMKEVDGIKATQYLKTVDPAARVVIVTNFDQGDLREAAFHAGAFAYVVKENLFALVELLAGSHL